MTLDLEPATKVMAELVAHVTDDQLSNPTPCPAYSLGDLLDHVGGLSLAFTAAATKETAALAGQGPSGDASRLGTDWRTRIPRDLAELANAWRDPNAWTGMTQAGGIDLPGEVAGLVALDEIVIHGWDVARATGQPFDPDPALLEAVHGFVAQFSGPGQEEARAGLFGPEVEVAPDRPLLDRVIGMTGRDPGWAAVSR
ncbi:MAG: TIGR03086 family metal-binding protein [Acidimicrobiia bacterium]